MPLLSHKFFRVISCRHEIVVVGAISFFFVDPCGLDRREIGTTKLHVLRPANGQERKSLNLQEVQAYVIACFRFLAPFDLNGEFMQPFS